MAEIVGTPELKKVLAIGADANSVDISGLPSPATSSSAANKAYVDAAVATAGAVTSVFSRTGAVVATSGDYTTAQITEVTNLYYTNARGIASTLTGYTSGAGSITSADTVLSAIQKLNGNIAAIGPTTGFTTNRVMVSDASGILAVSTVSTNQLQYLASSTGTTGTISTNLVFSANPTFTGTVNTDILSINTLHAVGSGGMLFESNSGTDIILLGAGGGSGVTFYGGINAVSATFSSTLSASNLSGTNTGDQTTVTGNAGTATALQTARTINGVSFNGTANITVTADAGTLTGTTLNSSVVTSSLTTVGTIGTGTWQGGVVAGQYGGTGVANTGKTITLGGNFTTSGAFTTTLTVTATTNVTLPTSGTLYGTATGSITSAQLAASLTNETGTGFVVFSDSPTFSTAVTLPYTTATSMVVGGGTFNLSGASQINQALGGTLSSTANTEINISSIGVLSANQQTLTTSAYRISAGSDWTTTAMGMSMNVDTTIRASYVGVSQALWFNPNGGITIGPTPYIGSHSNFTIVGSTSGYSANTVFSSIVNTASSSQLDFFVSNASSGFHPLVAGINLNNLNAFNFTFSGTEIMRVTTAGLGIGTSTVNAFLNLAGATTAKASLNITSGAAPATPNNGDIWFDGTDFKARVGGTTKTFTLI